MDNPILQSEGFERAANRLAREAETFTRVSERMEEAARQFMRAVDKQAQIAGMQAENAMRKYRNEAPAYVEDNFVNL